MNYVMKPSLIILMVTCAFYVMDNLVSIFYGGGVVGLLVDLSNVDAGKGAYRYIRLLFYIGLFGFFVSIFRERFIKRG